MKTVAKMKEHLKDNNVDLDGLPGNYQLAAN